MPKQKQKLQRFELPASYELPVSFSREIGRIIVHWAYFEHSVQRLVWLLMGVDEQEGRIGVREPRVEDRLDMIRDLAELKSFPLDAKAMSFIKGECEKVRIYRDLLAHGLWMQYPDNTWRIAQVRGQHPPDTEGPPQRSRRINPGAVPISLGTLQRTTQHIQILIEGIKPLEKKIVERFGTSRQKPA